MDRKQLDLILNQNRQLYQDQLKKMRDAGASQDQLEQMRQMLRNKEVDLTSQFGDDLQKMNIGKSINVGNATVSPGLDQSKLPDISKQIGLGKEGMFKKIGASLNSIPKGVKSVIPGLGVAAALTSGDPAMAAEETAQDLMGPAGLAYEAIRPTESGNPEEEKMMLAERDAMGNYANSPAAQDVAKFRKIRASLGK